MNRRFVRVSAGETRRLSLFAYKMQFSSIRAAKSESTNVKM